MCNKGSDCIYSHDRSLSNRGTLPCKYFLTGTCAYGDNCRFSHEQPFTGDIHIAEPDQKIFLPKLEDTSQQYDLDGQQITSLYPQLLNPPQEVQDFGNDSTPLRQYNLGYEAHNNFPNFLADDPNLLQQVSPEPNSYYNESTMGDDSGVDDLTYQFDTSITLDQVPNVPDAPMAITPTCVLWTTTGPYRSVTPGITSSPYSPPPFSDTSWAEAPEFVPRINKSHTVTMNSHNAINLQSPALEEVSSNTTNGRVMNYSNSSNQDAPQVIFGLERQSIMPLSIESLHNMTQHLPSLIPSSTSSRGVSNAYEARSNIHSTGISFQNSNIGYPNSMESGNHSSTINQNSFNDQKYEMIKNNMPHLEQFTLPEFQKRNMMQTRQELPPPPPPPSQDDKNGQSGGLSTVPKTKTWAQVVNGSSNNSQGNDIPPGNFKTIEKAVVPTSIADAESQLCPFSLVGECRYGEHCAYVHGLVCDLCGTPSLHPNHEKQRKRHQEVSRKIRVQKCTIRLSLIKKYISLKNRNEGKCH